VGSAIICSLRVDFVEALSWLSGVQLHRLVLRHAQRATGSAFHVQVAGAFFEFLKRKASHAKIGLIAEGERVSRCVARVRAVPIPKLFVIEGEIFALANLGVSVRVGQQVNSLGALHRIAHLFLFCLPHSAVPKNSRDCLV
jgi:hypothetical protein